MRRELRRATWLLGVYEVALIASAGVGLWGAVVEHDLVMTIMLFVFVAQAVMWGMRWWPTARAFGRARTTTEAQPAAVATSRWGDRVTMREDGVDWVLHLQPTRLLSPHVPGEGQPGWTLMPIREDDRPTVLGYDGAGRPRVSVSRRRATRVAETES